MVQRDTKSYPVVDASTEQGRSFRLLASLSPSRSSDWGDRDFIEAGKGRALYLTWDYGPSARDVKFLCPPSGSCSFSHGDLNIVVQRSTDGGHYWSSMMHVSGHYPASGADSAPLLVAPNGDVDLVYQSLRTNPQTYKLSPGHLRFSRSSDGGRTWYKPIMLGRHGGTTSTLEWWIDGAIAIYGAGDLYATWDTQGSHDVGWLSSSTNSGRTWSAPVQVTVASNRAVHIVPVASASDTGAVVGWLTDSSRRGYALYLRSYSISTGWLGRPMRISGPVYGKASIWPGDTFGISPLARTSLPGNEQRTAVSWGSTVSGTTGQIYATTAVLPA